MIKFDNIKIEDLQSLCSEDINKIGEIVGFSGILERKEVMTLRGFINKYRSGEYLNKTLRVKVKNLNITYKEFSSFYEIGASLNEKLNEVLKRLKRIEEDEEEQFIEMLEAYNKKLGMVNDGTYFILSKGKIYVDSKVYLIQLWYNDTISKTIIEDKSYKWFGLLDGVEIRDTSLRALDVYNKFNCYIFSSKIRTVNVYCEEQSIDIFNSRFKILNIIPKIERVRFILHNTPVEVINFDLTNYEDELPIRIYEMWNLTEECEIGKIVIKLTVKQVKQILRYKGSDEIIENKRDWITDNLKEIILKDTIQINYTGDLVLEII